MTKTFVNWMSYISAEFYKTFRPIKNLSHTKWSQAKLTTCRYSLPFFQQQGGFCAVDKLRDVQQSPPFQYQYLFFKLCQIVCLNDDDGFPPLFHTHTEINSVYKSFGFESLFCWYLGDENQYVNKLFRHVKMSV